MALPVGGNAHLSAATLLWGLISGFSYALYYLFGKRYFLRYTPALFFAYAMPAGALGLLPLIHFDPIGAAGWGSILFISLVSTYLAYLLYGQRAGPLGGRPRQHCWPPWNRSSPRSCPTSGGARA